MKRKDALTDLVEHMQETEPVEVEKPPSGERQVVNEQGETITLGQKPPSKVDIFNKMIPLELPSDGLERLRASLSSAFKKEVDKNFQKNQQNVDK
jgi:hypothetical protein